MSKPNAMQAVACKVYGGGDFSHLAETEDWRAATDSCGDTLFRFIMSELSDQEDCTDWDTAIKRMVSAANDVQTVLDALIDDPRNVDTENTTGHVDPTFGGCA